MTFSANAKHTNWSFTSNLTGHRFILKDKLNSFKKNSCYDVMFFLGFLFVETTVFFCNRELIADNALFKDKNDKNQINK